VHQIELEVQNDELIRTQVELERARERYFELYRLAPVGYLSLSEEGRILEANQCAAALLRTPAETLVGRWLSRFVLPEDGDAYESFHKRLFGTGQAQAAEVRLAPRGADAPTPWVRLEATLASDEKQEATVAHTVLSDIT
jgi:PAS domain S-box-containing protein